MNPDLQNTLTEFEEVPSPFPPLIKRGAALLLDELIVLVLTIINCYNQGTLKSPVLFTIILLIQGMYKPFFETRYGATPGKMMLRLQVVNNNFEPLALKNALLRTCFNSIFIICILVIGLMTFASDDLIYVRSYLAFTQLQDTIVNRFWLLIPMYLFVTIDIICVLADKKKRSLHDFIGSTLVINKSQPSAKL